MSRTTTVVELDGSRLCAIAASVGAGTVMVTRWLSALKPDTIAADDLAALGAWVREELDRASVPRSRVVLSVSRGDVVLKRLPLPAAAVGPDDLAPMVRLAMTRHLSMPLEGTSIDFAPPESAAPSLAAGAARAGRTVMAGAMPGDRVRWCQALSAAAGLGLRRIGLRCFGASALLSELSQRRAGTVLGVAVGWGSTEFVVVEDGQMVFARAADTPRPTSRDEVEAFAERVAVEAKRTWMSHRSASPGPAPEFVAVLGEGELSRRVGERCAQTLESPWELVGAPALVTLPASMPESERSAAAPLVGLLVESAVGRPTLDFANPRRAPDRAARRRQLTLAGVFAGIVLIGGAWVASGMKLADARGELAKLQKLRRDLKTDLDQALVRDARLNHVLQWIGADVDWLGHMRVLAGQIPDGGTAQLDEISGSMSARTLYCKPLRGPDAPREVAVYPDAKGEWVTLPQVRFSLTGTVSRREVAQGIRSRLITGDLYTVETLGADVSDRFNLSVTTGVASPELLRPADSGARPSIVAGVEGAP